ncbi:MAG: endolytic transglycosylase MltG [bacterium]
MKRIIIIGCIVVTSLTLLVIYCYIILFRPLSATSQKKNFKIAPGSSVKSIAENLEKEGIIRNKLFFWVTYKLKGEPYLKAGEYEVDLQMSLLEVFHLLEKGHIIQYKVTIPEGYNIKMIAQLLEELELTTKDSFLQQCLDVSFIKELGIEGSTVEGFLFPETYFFAKGIGNKEMIRVMIKRFWNVFTPEMVERSKEMGYSVFEIVTMASLIEKETAIKEEMPKIAAVFYNRLKGNIRLQCDPSVIYGLPNYQGNLTKKDLKTYHPYNTYRISGLPRGPIANPGKDALMAALYPANVKYKYFVSKNNGSHIFSETLRQHNRAVWKYQKRRVN